MGVLSVGRRQNTALWELGRLFGCQESWQVLFPDKSRPPYGTGDQADPYDAYETVVFRHPKILFS